MSSRKLPSSRDPHSFISSDAVPVAALRPRGQRAEVSSLPSTKADPQATASSTNTESQETPAGAVGGGSAATPKRTSMQRFHEYLGWSSLTSQERRIFSLFCLEFFLVVGGYWLVRPIKMGLFVALVGLEHEPQAKLGTVLMLIPILLAYNKLFELYPIKKLMFTVLTFYATIFVLIAIGTTLPDVGPSETTEPSAYNLLGWITYWTIETFGSVVVPMFWSAVASFSKPEVATVVYPVLVVVSQLGAVGGATLATYSEDVGFPFLVFVQAINIAAIVVIMLQIFLLASETAVHGTSTKKPPTGLLEGIRLIGTRKYVFGITVISTFAEIVSTIMDYQMKVVARAAYNSPEEFAKFMGHFGQVANLVSLTLALTGTSFFIRTFGLRSCLVGFPFITLILICLVYSLPLLWVIFLGMVAIKAFGYSLNNPSKEMLYLSTSKDIKFKSKSWIDMFGTRSAKAIGSSVNNALRSSHDALLSYGSAVSASFVSVWLVIAWWLGTEQHRLSSKNEIVQ